MILLGFVFLLVCTTVRGGTRLYPYKLLNTGMVCERADDCQTQTTHSWCASAMLCIHRQCRQLLEFPCHATQRCDEETHRCLDVPCHDDSECDNGVFCDGNEVCRDSRCVTDEQYPSCLYLGGMCDEQMRECRFSSVLHHMNKDRWLGARITSLSTQNTTTETPGIVNVTTLAVIGGVTGALFLFFLIVVVGRSVRDVAKQQ